MGATNPADSRTGHDPRRPRALDAGQPRARLRLAGVGASASSRSGSPMSSSELPTTRATATAWDAAERRSTTDARAPRCIGRRTETTLGRVAAARGGARRPRRRRREGRARARLRHGAVVDRCSRAAARASSGSTYSERQLEHAARRMAAAGLEFPLVDASAEEVPLPDASFDLVVSDYGAIDLRATRTRWCRRRRGCCGRAGCSPSRDATPLVLCSAERRGRRDASARLSARTSGCTASTARTSRSSSTSRTASGSGSSAQHGFAIEDADRDAAAGGRRARPTATAEETEWARSWPMEEIWTVRKRMSDLTEHARAQPGGLGAGGRRRVPSPARSAHWATDGDHVGDLARARRASSGSLGDVDGNDVVELGCGTAYVSAWLARRGAARRRRRRDSERSSRRARRMQPSTALEFPLVDASAEDVPLPDESFDLVVSEYGASIWCDPTAGSPRRRGCFARAASSSSSSTARSDARSPGHGSDRAGAPSLRPYFGMHRFEWPDDGRRLPPRLRRLDPAPRAHGFEVEGSSSSQPGPRRDRTTYFRSAGVGAQRWPAEEIWKARKPRERPPAPPLLLASTSPQRRAILEQLGIPFDVVAPALRGARPARRRPGRARPRARARARRARSRAERATGPCSASTRRSCSTAACYGKAAERRGRRARCCAALGGRDARGRLGPLPRHAGLGGASSTRSTRVTFRALTARDIDALRRDRRVGGPRRRATRSRASAPRSSSGSRATT